MLRTALVRGVMTPRSPGLRYFWAVAGVAIGTVFGFLVRGFIAPVNLAMVYLLVVVVVAAYLGRGPATLAAGLGVLVLDFFFIPPHLSFRVSDTQYLLTFIGLLSVGIVISELTARVRDQMEAVEQREIDTAALFGLSRDLTVASGVDAILEALATHVRQVFGREVVLFMPADNDPGRLKPYANTEPSSQAAYELRQAERAFELGDDQLPGAGARFIPLRTARANLGVLAVRQDDSQSQLSPEQRRLLEAFANQAAQAIERVQLADRARQVQVMQATEKLQSALLNSISHDLRTPLVTITGALSTLKETESGELILPKDEGHSLVETAYQEAVRLNRLVGNLLNMTRLEAGALKVVKQDGDVQDVIGSALEQLRERLGDRRIQVDVPADTPLIPMDFVLIVQVLVNMIDNALKYSGEGQPIEIQVQPAGDCLEIQVADRGIGIPAQDLQHVFDKFYRVKRPGNVSGTGLGLSICKGIAEAHCGSMRVENRPGGGTLVTLALPLKAEESSRDERE